MKNTLLLIFLLCSAIMLSQTTNFAGTYEKRTKTQTGAVLEYTVSLKPEGTFTYHFYRNIDPTQPEEHFYGKGTWEVDKNTVLFYTDAETEMDSKYMYDFTNTKARFIQKKDIGNPKAPKKTYFLFYESDLRVIKGLKLFKLN